MKLNKEAALQRRHKRVRGKISGTAARPRLAVHRSLQHIYAQLIDDATGRTLAAASSNEPAFRDRRSDEIKGWNIHGAKVVGQLIAERAKAEGITAVVYDRGGYPYHGRIRALAESAREGGLQF